MHSTIKMAKFKVQGQPDHPVIVLSEAALQEIGVCYRLNKCCITEMVIKSE